MGSSIVLRFKQNNLITSSVRLEESHTSETSHILTLVSWILSQDFSCTILSVYLSPLIFRHSLRLGSSSVTVVSTLSSSSRSPFVSVVCGVCLQSILLLIFIMLYSLLYHRPTSELISVKLQDTRRSVHEPRPKPQ